MTTPQNTTQHIVLDLETLSTQPHAAVLSIGAVALDERGQTVSEFHVALEPYASQPGRHIEAETLEWWGKQSAEARAASIDATGLCSAADALRLFSVWVSIQADPDDVKVWGNGSSFDNVILASLYKQTTTLGLPPPWRYWNDRDMRTLLDDFPQAKDVGAFEGIKHHALHDARHEAKQLAKALKWRRVVAACGADARTLQDFAIEHAEYMAQAAEQLVEAINAESEITARLDNGGYATQAEFDVDADALDSAHDLVAERMGGLKSDIYEFRKRRDRAITQESK